MNSPRFVYYSIQSHLCTRVVDTRYVENIQHIMDIMKIVCVVVCGVVCVFCVRCARRAFVHCVSAGMKWFVHLYSVCEIEHFLNNNSSNTFKQSNELTKTEDPCKIEMDPASTTFLFLFDYVWASIFETFYPLSRKTSMALAELVFWNTISALFVAQFGSLYPANESLTLFLHYFTMLVSTFYRLASPIWDCCQLFCHWSM